jgi:hypothetical protein
MRRRRGKQLQVEKVASWWTIRTSRSSELRIYLYCIQSKNVVAIFVASTLQQWLVRLKGRIASNLREKSFITIGSQ